MSQENKDDIRMVSILITAYNREKYLAESIESVLASTYTNFELIVVDDCSTDATIEIAKKFERKDERVIVYKNEKNIGDYRNRNKAASYARGKYLKYVDSDDKLYPDGLMYCVNCMEAHPEADWGIIYPSKIEKEVQLTSKSAIQDHFFKEPFLKAGPGQTILKKDFFMKAGMYPTKYGPANDMYFNLEAASLGNTLLLNDQFLFYRRHDEQEQSNQFSYLYNYNTYLKDALQELQFSLSPQQIEWLNKKRKRRFAVNILRYFLRTGNFKKTIEAIEKADYSFNDFLKGIFHFAPHPPEESFAGSHS
jgi:glycosyltransferase involved in cell wall biosynthesis